MQEVVKYLPRLLDNVLEERLEHHPAILLVGPRATGKTTTAARLARTELRLDDPGQAVAVRADPAAAIRHLEEPILIDEWQIVPEILSAVKRAVDTDPRPGRFLITGSVRGDLASPTWPGTGRLIRVPMFGLTVGEQEGRLPPKPLMDRLAEGDLQALTSPPETPDLRGYAELALRGGFPAPVLCLPENERTIWLDSYIEHLLTRDAMEIAGRRDPSKMRAFVEAYALNTAEVVERSTIFTSAGVAKATGEAYERLLSSLFVVEHLPAWWSNRLKRLVRGPKRMMVDSSLALAALRMDLRGLMSDGNLLGSILETFVVAQLRAEQARCAFRPRLFHLRQEQGRREIDLMVEYGGGRVFGIEVKATASPTAHEARHLSWLRDILKERFIGGAVLHTGPRSFFLDDRVIAAPISTLWA